MWLKTNSLATRLVAGAALLITIGMIGGAVVLASLFRASVERGFDSYLTVLMDGLITVSVVDQKGRISFERDPGDPRFRQPLSGWYWRVAHTRSGVVKSVSLGRERFDFRAFDGGKTQYYNTSGPSGQRLRVASRRIKFPEADRPFLFIVAGDRSELEEEVEAFTLNLAWALGVLGLALIVVVFLQVRFGLQPLRRIPPALAAIRSGKSDRLTGRFPAEVEPLATEINELLAHNEEVVDRARTHVGNLAHALKTPLAVLTNEAADDETTLARTVGDQAAIMRQQVEHHLARARLAARAGILGARTSIAPVLDDLRRTLLRIHQDKGLRIDVRTPDDAAFRGERQDLEEILGNLMDNACKWAARKVKVKVKPAPRAEHDGAEAGPMLRLTIEDDGHGLTPTERRTALKRGMRLDETAPGSGLGLAIVRDIAEIYGGAFELTESEMGGLCAVLILPAVE